MQEDAEIVGSPKKEEEATKADSNSPAAAPANKNSAEATPEQKAEEGYLNNNRRHRQDFNKLKSSNAMKTLLAADLQDEKK